MTTVLVNPRKELKEILEGLPGILQGTVHIGSLPRRTARVQMPYIVLRAVGERYKDDYYEYMRQRVDIFFFASSVDEAEELDLMVYSVLDSIDGGFPIVQAQPGGSYDIVGGQAAIASTGKQDANIQGTGVWRSYRILYVDSYDDGEEE